MTPIRSLSLQEFEKEFGPLYHSIFSGKEIDTNPFRSLDWQMLLLPYGANMEEEDFRALALAAGACGDREMVLIIDAETIDPSATAVIIPGFYRAFEKVKFRPGTYFATIDTHLFGRSGCWGCICAASLDDVAIVGGNINFIANFAEAIGGIDGLQNRFHEFSKTEWSVSEELKLNLLRMVGWHRVEI